MPWVVVAGGAYGVQGMDGANAALAQCLLDSGRDVHLVAHKVDAELKAYPNLTYHPVGTPAGSYLLGEVLLDRAGRRVAQQLSSPRVIVNGANCRWEDVNWVHSVHQSWPCCDAGAPGLFRVKNRLAKVRARRRERRTVPNARIVIANSESTKSNLMAEFGIRGDRIHVVYLGSDASFGVPSPADRAAAREWLGVCRKRPLAAFAGALSFDNNKGLDTLLEAWRQLVENPLWDVDLVVAGGGSGVFRWRSWVRDRGLGSRIRILGHTSRIPDVLSAADVLVSPVRYEAYGLNVQEAICRGVPAIVSASAGVAERYTAAAAGLLLRDANDAGELKSRLLSWRSDMAGWKQQFEPLGATLRSWTWRSMAERIVEIAA